MWLSLYGITADHINRYDLFWDPTSERIVFPYENKFAWMRSLDKNQKAKWLRVGEKGILAHYRNSSERKVVLTEDIVSAIRVADFSNVICLGGTSAKKDQIAPLLNLYDEIIIWLDGDVAGQRGAEKIRNQLKLTKKIRIVYTAKDPKAHTTDEIKKILCQ
jgi:5S rRNA maturation endonuclease (ribonuclease M5)